MTTLLTSVLTSPLFWLYSIIFLIIVLLKQLFRVKVAINTIWFSMDGSVSKDVIENLLQLSKDIKRSPFKKNYTIYFWTDKEKLDQNILKKFQRSKIRVKNYHDASYLESDEKTALQWIEELLAIGNNNSILCYVLASDILRLHLIMREFPGSYSFQYTCYIDCNDIQINQIPNPASFSKLDHLAFHFVRFNYANSNLSTELADCPDESRSLLINDVILANNKKHSLIKKRIFSYYMNNLRHLSVTEANAIDLLKSTCKTFNRLDNKIIFAIVFTTTHMVNLLYDTYHHKAGINLLKFTKTGLEKEQIKIEDVLNYIDCERIYDKGYTWIRQEDFEPDTSAASEEYRQYWYQLFQKRYQLHSRLVE